MYVYIGIYYIYIYIYIYIYMCVCVCVCVYERARSRKEYRDLYCVVASETDKNFAEELSKNFPSPKMRKRAE